MDIHDFLISTQRGMHEEYERILKRATEDPGTAGDQGEENWASLLRNWLPNYFQIVTKGRILCDNGYASPQIDVLILHPSYPQILLEKKLYLAGGVAAAFECKTTLKASHIREAVQTAADIRRNLPKRFGSPYKELNSNIIYGLLAHSHSWKSEKSTPIENIQNSLINADEKIVKHPYEQIDYVCVSDLGTWQSSKTTYISPLLSYYNEEFKRIYGEKGSAITSFVASTKNTENQKDYFTPIGNLLAGLFSKLSWQFVDMRELDKYFRKVNMYGNGSGRMRLWPLEIYSESIRNQIFRGQLSNGESYDEWGIHF